MSKGQVSLFVVVGVILVVIVLFFLFFFNKDEAVFRAEYDEFGDVSFFVKGCLRSVANKGLSNFSYSGSVINRDDVSLFLQDFIFNNLDSCLDNFSFFEGRVSDISFGDLDVSVFVGDKITTIDVVYPIRMDFDDEELFISKFSLDVPFDFEYLNNISSLKRSMVEFVNDCLFNVSVEGFEGMGYGLNGNSGFDRDLIGFYISSYVVSNIDFCIDDFSSLNLSGFAINKEFPSVDVYIGDYESEIVLDYFMFVSFGNINFSLNNFSAVVPFNYKDKKNEILSIVRSVSSDLYGFSFRGDFNRRFSKDVSISDLSVVAYDEDISFDYVYTGADKNNLILNLPVENRAFGISHSLEVPVSDFEEVDYTFESIPVFEFDGSSIYFELFFEPGISYVENSDFISIDDSGQMIISGDVPVGDSRSLVKFIRSNGEVFYDYVVIKN